MPEDNDTEILIEDLKKLAKEKDQQAIIAFCVERDGTVRCVTYGEDKLKCDAAGWWGQGTLNNDIPIIPFQTVFGWGNNGKPKKLTEEQLKEARKHKIPKEFFEI